MFTFCMFIFCHSISNLNQTVTYLYNLVDLDILGITGILIMHPFYPIPVPETASNILPVPIPTLCSRECIHYMQHTLGQLTIIATRSSTQSSTYSASISPPSTRLHPHTHSHTLNRSRRRNCCAQSWVNCAVEKYATILTLNWIAYL